MTLKNFLLFVSQTLRKNCQTADFNSNIMIMIAVSTDYS